MGTWRCPHCATLQAEALRCFVCQRSATSCSTCLNFRRSLVGGLGYCALDRRREPLSGAEQRPCWTATAQAGADGFFDLPAPPAPEPPALGRSREKRGLIELAPRPPSPGAGGPAVSGT